MIDGQYERRPGRVIRVELSSGRIYVDLTDEGEKMSVILPSTAFVGGLTRRAPTTGDQVMVSFSVGQPVSGRLLRPT